MNTKFKRIVILSALTVLMGIAIVYALGYEFTPQSSTQTIPTAEGVNDQFGLKLTMTLQKTEYSLAEPINITLTITNIGNQTITYQYPALDDRFDFRVYNGTGNSIYHWSNGRVWNWEMDPVTLNPRESLTVGQIAGDYRTSYCVWDQTWNDLSVYPPHFDSTQVSLGTYYIVGQTGGICVEGHGEDICIGIIETTPIQVTIVAP